MKFATVVRVCLLAWALAAALTVVSAVYGGLWAWGGGFLSMLTLVVLWRLNPGGSPGIVRFRRFGERRKWSVEFRLR